MRELVLAEPANGAAAEPDASLVQEALRNPAAFAALYRRYVGPVHRYLYSRAHNAADADDLTADVFTEALKALPRYRERGRFAAWLFTIARRKAAGHHRRRRPQVPLDQAASAPAATPDPLAVTIRNESLASLAAVLARLDEDQQELLRLRYAAGLTYGEIGELLCRSEAAVKMALRRLVQRLDPEVRGASEGEGPNEAAR